MWRLAYRFNGKQKTLALGHYPTGRQIGKRMMPMPEETPVIHHTFL